MKNWVKPLIELMRALCKQDTLAPMYWSDSQDSINNQNNEEEWGAALHRGNILAALGSILGVPENLFSMFLTALVRGK